jgi:UDP-glucose 4-epimerase
MNSTRTCLVVGGNGFIGKNLTQNLLNEDWNIITYDITKPSLESAKLQYIKGSIEDTPLLLQAAESVMDIIWLVHTSVPATSMHDVESDLLSNVPPLLRFLRSLPKQSGPKRFIYLSSGGTVYGDPMIKTPIVEDSGKDPISSYGLTKLIAEEYLTFSLKRSAIATFILRPSNVYGRYQNLKKPQGIIGHAFKSILTHQPIHIFGDGSIIRDYIHVSDLAEAVIRCMKSDYHSTFPLILNIGSGKETSINDILRLVGKITKSPVAINRLPDRDFDCKFNVLSIERALTEIGWHPKTELETGLQDVWDWIKSDASALGL